MNLMQKSSAWLGGQLKRVAGRQVAITQGENTIGVFTGWCSMKEHIVEDAEGFATRVVAYDWKFNQSDLPSGFRFRRGALIQEETSSGLVTYEALPLVGQPESEPVDVHGEIVVVHTKRIR